MYKRIGILILCVVLWAGMRVPAFAAEKTVELLENPVSSESATAEPQESSAEETPAEPQETDGPMEVAGDLEELGEALEETEPEEQKGLEAFQQKELILFLEQGALKETYGAANVVYYEPLVEYILQYDSPEETQDAFHNLVKSYGEDAVMVNLPVETKAASWSQTTSNRTSARSVSWGSDAMLLDALRDKAGSAGGPSGKVIVGVLDSGVNPTHELLKGRISPASAAIEKYIAAGSTPYLDENGHGTHVAGIIADATPPQVEILAVRTTDSNGGGDFNSLLVGMQYAASHGARVINVSFGGDLYTNSGISVARYQAILDNYEKAIHNICSNYDCMVVVAAGNSGMDIETSKAFPSCFPEVITVGALNTDLKRASFSNYGKNVDFGAPGVDVASGWNAGNSEYKIATGTSMAAPHVTAAAAMVRLYNPGLNRTEAEDVLRGSVTDITPKGIDRYTGCGMIRLGSSQMRTSFSLAGTSVSAGPATWSGRALSPSVRATLRGRALTQGKEFTVTYSNNKKVGVGRFTIRGKGRYTGTRSGTFRIVPKGTRLTKYRPGKKKLTLKWVKQKKQTSGYQIQISRSISFGKGTRTITVGKPKKSSVKIKKLKRRTEYYVRIRTYKKVGKQKYYSAWSTKGIVRTV